MFGDVGKDEVVGLDIHFEQVRVDLLLLFEFQRDLLLGGSTVLVEFNVVLDSTFSQLVLGVVVALY